MTTRISVGDASLVLLVAGALSCADERGTAGSGGMPTGGGSSGSGTDSSGDPSGGTPGSGGSGSGEQTAGDGDGDGDGDSGSGGIRLDVDPGGSGGGAESGGGNGSCRVGDPVDGDDCTDRAPADSFEPEVQWSWDGQGSITTPLVANLTDDNGDGSIDLCDIPDVVVVDGSVSTGQGGGGRIVVLDGATGAEHYAIPTGVEWTLTPALGDIDDDGIPEIVTGTGGVFAMNLIAFEHDGTQKWISADPWDGLQALHSALALADLDNDGDVEIIAGNMVFDHLGNRQWVAPIGLSTINATTAADLDGDGDLEVVIGPAAYHHDGTEYYNNAGISSTGIGGVFPQVADLDGDAEPEILVAASNGIFILEHTGATKVSVPVAGSGSAGGLYPATIHDFDGDDISEFALSSGTLYTAYKADGAVAWSSPVVDASGVAAGTAFDFLGDGVAEAMYADEQFMFVFDGADGSVLLEVPRSSGTSIEYPTVVDVDNDGSAEILVVSNASGTGGKTAPSVQAIRDRQDRWIQARRIWNQHTYHVTNVREDGTIPRFEQPHWEALNTFRTNAQIENGGVCEPPVG